MRSKSNNLVLLLTVGLLTLLANCGVFLFFSPVFLLILIPCVFGINALHILSQHSIPEKSICYLIYGNNSLRIYLVSTLLSVVYQLILGLVIIKEFSYQYIFNLITCISVLTATLYIGSTIIYCTSSQLRLSLRILGICLGLIPIVNVIILILIVRKTNLEIQFESKKELLNQQRQSQQICKTKYPILMVHGIFFRDNGHFEYWGRIPDELQRNGATIYYGNQPSAASVPECAQILAKRIKEITQETGCEKVNIIAHSKGGLDCRYAMAFCGATPYVASLTTISTPHRGSLFADYLLEKVSQKNQKRICNAYNKTMNRMGEPEADLISAAQQLTTEYCTALDEQMPTPKDVLCQSFGSKLLIPRKGHFPLNFTGAVMTKKISQSNDGLVCEDSFSWGNRYTLLKPDSSIGLSHGDVTDFSRYNHPDFDVREFYVQLVSELKDHGL